MGLGIDMDCLPVGTKIVKGTREVDGPL